MNSRVFSISINYTFIIILLLFIFTYSCQALATDDDYSVRKLYPQVSLITKEQLYDKIKKNEVVVVDVRSDYEYQTLQILNAINISVSKKSFAKQLQALRAGTDKDIVFYCNGLHCYKSYQASMKALKYKVKNCYSYDHGIIEWTLRYPSQAVLLGETPVDQASIISDEEYNSHVLPIKEFEKKLISEDRVVYDIRDREQRRGGGSLFMFRSKYLGLSNSKKLNKIINNAIEDQEPLLFFGENEHQAKWLQYTLKKQGLSEYYFMEGGALAYYQMMRTEQGL